MSRALIVIDVQESFRQRAAWRTTNNPDITDDVNALVHAARADGDLVVWVLHAEPGTGGVFDPVHGHVRLLPELDYRDDEPLLVKTSVNAFTTTNLAQLLTQRGVRELRVCGIRAEQCVETTTRVGFDLGYEMTYVVDAVASFATPPPEAPDDLADPRTKQAEEIVEHAAFILATRGFAKVATVAELAGTLTGS
ncbi:cysteine hydrolase family protein [Actinophytocola algeriensis]|uniref:Nicotinamidase-related amidase n=1 Tax=Actinophytocola algeriensis TaxID=1768010 RepID=A0A7W7VF39_9PSEU|nr:isochorismatase family protein [Actinophytocola algeriensis]MBB4907887.1 nicotinamidase-related amidase [Actinophytocola algeriensis]MBE1479917.1 nicotinamidase-related amidase [Actinophytocola algeriensis]